MNSGYSENRAEKLRILMVHARYLTRGGEDESTDQEIALLRSSGHEVNFLEVENKAPKNIVQSLGQALDATWSFKYYNLVRRMLRKAEYDVLHVQNFFPSISPSIYYAAARAKVPVVQAVRNYRLICPSANLFRDGQYCDLCVGKPVATDSLKFGCYRGSRLATGAVVLMQSFHRLIGTWKRRVALYVPLTEFVRARLVEGGIPSEKTFVKPNFLNIGRASKSKPVAVDGDYFIYVGRLAEEKGVAHLLEAWAARPRGASLLLVGDGPMAEGLAAAPPPGVVLLGRRPHDEVTALMSSAIATVLPALWAEPFGRVIIESYAAGRPVIAAKCGGIPELIAHGREGLLYDAGDSGELDAALSELELDRSLTESMAQGAVARFNQQFTGAANLHYLEDLYRKAKSLGDK